MDVAPGGRVRFPFGLPRPVPIIAEDECVTDQMAGEPFQGDSLAQERTGLAHSLLRGARKTVLCSCLPAPAPLKLQVLVVLVVTFLHPGVMSKLISLHSLSNKVQTVGAPCGPPSPSLCP